MHAQPGSSSSPPQVFELPADAKRRAARAPRTIGLVGGAGFFAGWAVLVLPLLLQAPHPFRFCGRGGCQTIAPADYYSTLDSFTALLLALAALFFLIALLTFRARETELQVDATGFTIVYGTKRKKRVSWDDPRMDCEFKDWRATYRAHPPDARQAADPILMSTGLAVVFPPVAAMEAILASARRAGLGVREEHGGYHAAPETIQYFVVPRRFQPATP